jgi:ring-1,2-phenylacetyl-CoA epoxidase subunit PaaE
MMGGCAACKVKLRSGAVHMGEPHALTSAERDDGLALACIARPLGLVEVEFG